MNQLTQLREDGDLILYEYQIYNMRENENESESHLVVSDSLPLHGLYSPWNSLGQYTGVGSHSLFPGDLPNPGVKPRSPSLQADSLPAEPPGKPKNTGVGSLSLLQGIFPSQGSNLGLPHCRRILCQLSHLGSPRILEWVAYPFSRGSSRPRNRTRVSSRSRVSHYRRFFTS